MRLSKTECQVAAECADQYPVGYGFVYVSVPFKRAIRRPTTADEAAYWFKLHPEDIPKGWPAVAVAAVRGALTGINISTSFGDLTDTLMTDTDEYSNALNDNPQSVARRLRAACSYAEDDSESDFSWNQTMATNIDMYREFLTKRGYRLRPRPVGGGEPFGTEIDFMFDLTRIGDDQIIMSSGGSYEEALWNAMRWIREHPTEGE